jgi:hypothetical protein
LLEGAVDTHVHSAPDAVPRSVDDLELARSAAAAGMAAVVLKNHHGPTAHRAYLAAQSVGGVQVLGGIALNGAVGGINPEAVEAAVRTGGRVVWMPTTSALNQIRATEESGHAHPSALHTPTTPTSLDDPGLQPALEAVLELIRDANAVLATGHLSTAEIDLLVGRAERVGVRHIVVTHPESPTVAMSIEQQRALAGRGVMFERCYNFTLPPRHAQPLSNVVAVIRDVGVGTTVLASDLGQAQNPAPVEGFGKYLAGLHEAGLTEAELRVAARENAYRLFSL